MMRDTMTLRERIAGTARGSSFEAPETMFNVDGKLGSRCGEQHEVQSGLG